jgi:DNA-binding NarL/FixJ family response regulator
MMSTAPARIYLIYSHPLLRDSVQAILHQAGLSLAGEALGAVGLETLAAIRPDIIIVEDGEDEVTEQILMHLTELGSPRLLTISLKDNKFYIYHREERLLTQTADLVAALQE